MGQRSRFSARRVSAQVAVPLRERRSQEEKREGAGRSRVPTAGHMASGLSHHVVWLLCVSPSAGSPQAQEPGKAKGGVWLFTVRPAQSTGPGFDARARSGGRLMRHQFCGLVPQWVVDTMGAVLGKLCWSGPASPLAHAESVVPRALHPGLLQTRGSVSVVLASGFCCLADTVAPE